MTETSKHSRPIPLQYVDVTIDTTDFTAGALEVLKAIRPEWKEEAIQFKRTYGGHMNQLLRCHVTHDPSDKILFRVNGPTSDQYVSRDREINYMQQLAAQGIAQPLHCRFANGVAYKYAEGEPVTAAIQGDEDISNLVIAQYHKLHAAHIEPYTDEEKDGVQVLKGWLEPFGSLVSEKWYTEKDIFPGKEELVQELKYVYNATEYLFKRKDCLVMCHNDLVIGNIIYDKHNGCVSFIDWEFASINIEEFDICLQLVDWAGFVPTKPYIRDWLRRYVQTHPNRGEGGGDVTEAELQPFYEDFMHALMIQTLVAAVWAMLEWKDGQDKSRTHEYRDIASSYLRQYYSAKEETQTFKKTLI